MWMIIDGKYYHTACVEACDDEYLDEMLTLGYYEVTEDGPSDDYCYICGTGED